MYKRIVLYILIAISSLSLDVYSKSGAWGVTGELQELFYAAAFHNEYANFINPAIITKVDQTEIVLYASPNLLGASHLFNGSVFVPIGLNQTAGVSYIGNGVWGIPLIGNDGKTYGSADFAHHTIYGSYANKILPYLSVGANITAFNKILGSTPQPGAASSGQLDFSSGWTVGGDLGVIFNPFNIMTRGYSSIYRGELAFGLTAKNALSWMQASGTMEDVSKNLLVGMHYGWRHLFDASFYANVSDLTPTPSSKAEATNLISANVNGDLRVQLHPLFGAKAGWTNDGIKAGVDFSYKRLSFIRFLQADYDLVFKPEHSIFVNNIKLVAKVGPTREEMYARSLFDILKLAPNDLYKRALEKYQEKKYWESAWLFSELVTKYPRYYLVDAAAYYLAEDFEKLGLDILSRDMFSKSLASYTASDYQDKYLLGLQNLDYKKGDYESSNSFHKQIETKYPKSTILGKSYYIAAQVKFNEGNYDESMVLLDRVKSTSEAYVYALYTKAVILAITDKYDESIKTLNDLRTKTATNDAQKMIMNRAHLLAGHLLQEKGNVKDALTEYMKVESSVPFFDEVQLSLAWGFLKYQKSQAAIGYANNLISQNSSSVLVPEAVLVKGFANHISGNFTEAVSNYEEAIKLTEGVSIDEELVLKNKVSHDDLVSKFNNFQDELKSAALERGVAKKDEKKSSLKSQYDDLTEKEIEYEAFINQISSIKKFLGSKNREKILNDASYAKANAFTEIQKQETEDLLKQQKIEEQKKIDEMKRLEEQLKNIE